MKPSIGLLCLLISIQVSGQGLLDKSTPFIKTFGEVESKILSDHILQISGDVSIIGLGEVSHYTKECYDFKHTIIKDLMEQGFNALVLEVDFGQALVWNDYVTQGIGNLDTLLRQSGWFTYRTEEFKALLESIRTFNRSADRPFQIFGMEMTAMNYNLDWLKTYFEKHLTDPKAIIQLLDQERKIVAFQNHDQVEQTDYWQLFYQLQKTLGENEESLIKNGGESAFAIAYRIAEITRQYATFISHDDFRFKVEIRDLFSTRNVLWAMNQIGEDARIVIWAHNGHVAKRSVLFNYDVLGHHLEQIFGDEYYAIGFTFNKADFGAFSSEGWGRWQIPTIDTASLTMDFHKLGSPFAILDIRSQLKTDFNTQNYLRQAQLIRRDLSESYDPSFPKTVQITLSETYDFLIYMDQTNYPTTLTR
ncbi:MAG: erythromycin esterase family protein [Bacteroidota bacterium]